MVNYIPVLQIAQRLNPRGATKFNTLLKCRGWIKAIAATHVSANLFSQGDVPNADHSLAKANPSAAFELLRSKELNRC